MSLQGLRDVAESGAQKLDLFMRTGVLLKILNVKVLVGQICNLDPI